MVIVIIDGGKTTKTEKQNKNHWSLNILENNKVDLIDWLRYNRVSKFYFFFYFVTFFFAFHI